MAADKHIKVAASQLRAFGHLLPSVCDCAKEIYANAEGYCTSGDTPFCDSRLFNEEDHDRAFIVFRSHSSLTPTTAKHVFHLGHLDGVEKKKHRRFNLGTYVVAGTMCRENKEGMIVASFNPATRTGLVMRAYVDAQGYVCHVEPVTITLNTEGMPTLFAAGIDVVERNRIEMLWLGTQWEEGEFNQGASHRKFCKMLYETTVEHAMQGNPSKPFDKPGGLHSTTSFIYFDLKTKVIDGATKCFIKSTDNDILEVDADGAYGFRTTVREHFLPHVNRMPLTGTDLRRRLFQVQGVPVTITASGAESSPWCARVVDAVNKVSTSGNDGWYQLCRDTEFPVWVKFAIMQYPIKKITDNFYKHGSLVLNESQALPVGVVVTHLDKVLNKSAWSALNGDYFQQPPAVASKWHGWSSQLLTAGRIKASHVSTLWELIGEPNAHCECDGETDEIRTRQRARNVSRIQVVLPDGTQIGFQETLNMFIRPYRRCRKKVDRAGVERTKGLFKIENYVNETTEEVQYMSREAVSAARESGDLEEGVNYSKREHLVLLAGLCVAAVMQVGECPQPMDKEKLQDPVDAKRLYKEFFKCMVHHVLSNPPAEVASMRDAFLLKWKEVAADSHKEDADVAWIREEYRRRVDAEDKRKAAASADAARRRAAAEANAKAEREKREEIERKQAEGIRMSARLNPEEEAMKDEAVQKELAKAKREQERLAKKEKKLQEEQEQREKKEREQKEAKLEEKERKKKLKDKREKSIASAFSKSVSDWTGKFGWPEAMAVPIDKCDPKGTLMSRGSSTCDVLRLTPCAEVADAVMHAFVPKSLGSGKKRKLADWVTGDSAKLMLEALMEDDNMPLALGLKFNPNHGAGSRKLVRLAPEPDDDGGFDADAGADAGDGPSGASGASGASMPSAQQPVPRGFVRRASAPPTDRHEEDESSEDDQPISTMASAQRRVGGYTTGSTLPTTQIRSDVNILAMAAEPNKPRRDALLKSLTPRLDMNFCWTCPTKGYTFRFLHMSRPQRGSDRYCFPPPEMTTLLASVEASRIVAGHSPQGQQRCPRNLQETADLLLAYKSAIEVQGESDDVEDEEEVQVDVEPDSSSNGAGPSGSSGPHIEEID
jgi:hypothetical protein